MAAGQRRRSPASAPGSTRLTQLRIHVLVTRGFLRSLHASTCLRWAVDLYVTAPWAARGRTLPPGAVLATDLRSPAVHVGNDWATQHPKTAEKETPPLVARSALTSENREQPQAPANRRREMVRKGSSVRVRFRASPSFIGASAIRPRPLRYECGTATPHGIAVRPAVTICGLRKSESIGLPPGLSKAHRHNHKGGSMRRILTVLATAVSMALLPCGVAVADTVTTDFEPSSGFTTGSVDGQVGWHSAAPGRYSGSAAWV